MRVHPENDNNIITVEEKEGGIEKTNRQASEPAVLSPSKEEKIVEKKKTEI